MDDRLVADDGHEFDCVTLAPGGLVWGGLVVLHEIFGITPQIRAVAARYAADGLRVIVPALFDRQRRGAVIPFDRPAEGRALKEAVETADVMRDIGAAVAALKAESLPVAVLGFCWGGGLAVRAAQLHPIDCAVSFYGTGLDAFLDRRLRAPVLGHFGDRDDRVPLALLERVHAALPGLEVQIYPAGHAFANEARPTHVPAAAALAHARTMGFLRAHLR